MKNIIELITNSEAETCRLAKELSNYASAGDFIGLTGDLGAGKSVFARAFLRALSGNSELEVPSPTFTLVQTYEDLRIKSSHFDLYRINNGAELDELGLEDSCLDGIALVEWPDRTLEQLFSDRLMITFEDNSPTQRKIIITAHGSWQFRLNRWNLSTGFLGQAGWGTATRHFLQGDASHRRYERVQDNNHHGVLMDMPHVSDGPVIRAGKSYSALAHLAEGVAPFISITRALQSLGLSAPEIFASQPDGGFLLLEDLGEQVFFDMAAQGEDMTVPMRAAVDVLVYLAEKTNNLQFQSNLGDYVIPIFDKAALQIEIELLPDWYWQRVTGSTISSADKSEFLDLWRPLWQHLEECPRVWTLRDYHSPNLIWLPDRTGVARVGLLDYQDTVQGAPAYDLVSLLQDARRNVTADEEAHLYDYYWQQIEHTSLEYNRENFDSAYAVLGAQRATKILGIFARLAERDHKPAYLAHIPRVRAYLQRNLQHPHLEHLKSWFDVHLPDTP